MQFLNVIEVKMDEVVKRSKNLGWLKAENSADVLNLTGVHWDKRNPAKRLVIEGFAQVIGTLRHFNSVEFRNCADISGATVFTATL